MPVWLENHENYAISGGLGFDQFGMAFGATGLMRLNQHMSVFVGGAIATSGAVVVDGMVYVGSGYAVGSGASGGNVLLAFGVE